MSPGVLLHEEHDIPRKEAPSNAHSQATTLSNDVLDEQSDSSRVPSPHLSLDLSQYPKLDALQVGHIRHFHNLTTQLDGEWNHMAGQESQQEFFDAYRYQISSMAYAAGVAHYHRLPAARSMFKKLLEQLIYKMLLRDVWGYWFNASLSGSYIDPDITQLRVPWANPIIKENIMYSGHLLLMTSLYAMLFDDDKYEKPGSLTLTWDPQLWGLREEVWPYDNRSIQAAIMEQMVKSNYVGVCCEPNLIFVVCNQFPLIAMRYNDIRDGTNVAMEVLEKYKQTWDKVGMVAPGGLYVDWLFENQQRTKKPSCICFTAWANAYMNTWNNELIESLFESQKLGFITSIKGEWQLHEFEFAIEYRNLVEEGGINVESLSDEEQVALYDKAQEMRLINRPKPTKYVDPVFGCVVQWLSELGKTTELDGLLGYADGHLNPTWEKGGLYYPRKDSPIDRDSVWRHMDPFTGNSGIAYSRLNVKNGQKMMWDSPWTSEVLSQRPWIDNIELSQDVDIVRATWDSQNEALILTLRSWNKVEITVEPTARNLDAGLWAVYIDGKLSKHKSIEAAGDMEISVLVGGHDIDIVFQRI